MGGKTVHDVLRLVTSFGHSAVGQHPVPHPVFGGKKLMWLCWLLCFEQLIPQVFTGVEVRRSTLHLLHPLIFTDTLRCDAVCARSRPPQLPAGGKKLTVNDYHWF